MTKIEEFEKHLIQKGLSDADFEAYKQLLRRVRGDFSKCQHCYTTAIQFPKKRSDEAIKLIKYGVENFDGGRFTEYTSYLYIGHICEKNGNYADALEAYLKAEAALGDEHTSYLGDISLRILWTKLHIDDFEYSDMLNKYYSIYLSKFSDKNELINDMYKRRVAQIVISIHNGDAEAAANALKEAKLISMPGFSGPMTALLSYHNYNDKLNTSKEAKRFLKRISQYISIPTSKQWQRIKRKTKRKRSFGR